MHRATAGLVELYVQKGEFFRASLLAYTQSLHYRNFEPTMRRRWSFRGRRWNSSEIGHAGIRSTSRGRRWPAI